MSDSGLVSAAWGSVFWFLDECVALGGRARHFGPFFAGHRDAMPCKLCRRHFTRMTGELDFSSCCSSNAEALRLVYTAHRAVSARLHKPTPVTLLELLVTRTQQMRRDPLVWLEAMCFSLACVATGFPRAPSRRRARAVAAWIRNMRRALPSRAVRAAMKGFARNAVSACESRETLTRFAFDVQQSMREQFARGREWRDYAEFRDSFEALRASHDSQQELRALVGAGGEISVVRTKLFSRNRE